MTEMAGEKSTLTPFPQMAESAAPRRAAFELRRKIHDQRIQAEAIDQLGDGDPPTLAARPLTPDHQLTTVQIAQTQLGRDDDRLSARQ